MVLTFIPVNGFCFKAVSEELLAQFVGAVFCSGKDQRLVPLIIDNQITDDIGFCRLLAPYRKFDGQGRQFCF